MAPPRSASRRLRASWETLQQIVNWCSDGYAVGRAFAGTLGTDRSPTTGPVSERQRNWPPRDAIRMSLRSTEDDSVRNDGGADTS